MVKHALPVLLLFVSSAVFGQTGYVLSGNVMGNDKQMVSVGDVFLLSVKDSAIVKYAMVTEGQFAFDAVSGGEYLLKVTGAGYKDICKPINLNKDGTLTLKMTTDATMLRNVSVTGTKKTFDNKHGNIKVNIENSVFATVPDPIDLLSKLPLVQVSADKQSLSMIGKGEPLIYLDNQRGTINDLASLRVGDIKTIEIINNPSAKYDAEGRAVILITRKTNRKDGTKCDLTETIAFRRYFQTRTSAGLSYKKNKLEIKLNAQYNHLKQWESNSNEFRIADRDFATRYTAVSLGIRQQYIFGGGVYYQVNDDDYLSVAVSERLQPDDFVINTNSYFQDTTAVHNVDTRSPSGDHRPYSNVTGNYSKNFKKINGQLFAGVQYSGFTRDLESHIYNNFDNTVEMLTQYRYQKYHINVLTARVDFEKKFKQDWKWETGINLSGARAKATSNAQTYDPYSTEYSVYNYAEKDQAAYTQLSKHWDKVNVDAGLRLENTNIQGGYQDSAKLLVDKKAAQLFPRASMDVTIDSTKSLRLYYARSISRPSYADASQITTYINPYFEFARNINIQPSITDEAGLNFQYKQNTIELSFYHISNPVYYAVEYSTQDHILRMINTNFKDERGIVLNLTIPVTYRSFTTTTVLSANINQVRDPSATLSVSKPYFYVYSSSQLRLPGDLTAFINGWAITKQYKGVFELSPMFQLDAGITRTFYKKLGCSLSCNNIFRSLVSKQQFTMSGIYNKGVYYDDTRELAIALKYSFGKLKDPKYKNKDVDDNAGRIK